MQPDSITTANRYTVLFVDDEANILRSIRRALHKTDLNVLLADSGQSALEVLARETVHVVVSDMKMPQMSGAELLEVVADQYPDTFRVVLSGYADIEATINAVNKGRIHRYLQKPWDNQALIKTIEDGLERVKLKDENNRLERLIRAQNKKLKDINTGQELTIQKRTRQIRAALSKIELNNHALEQVIYNIISINPAVSGKFAIDVSELAVSLSKQRGADKATLDNIRYAGLVCELGLLGLHAHDFSAPFNTLNYQQQQNYLSQTRQAVQMLAPAQHLQPVAEIIEHQFEQVNGAGPMKKVGLAIPLGARIIAVARDYWRLIAGRLTGQPMSDDEAKAFLNNYRNTRYDTDILDGLMRQKDIGQTRHTEGSVTASQLQPGMQLEANLYNDNHLLILPRGHVFTTTTIDKLRQIEAERNTTFAMLINAGVAKDEVITE